MNMPTHIRMRECSAVKVEGGALVVRSASMFSLEPVKSFCFILSITTALTAAQSGKEWGK